MFPICEELIAESSASRSGEEAILCEGSCEGSCGHWLHKHAGLSKALLPECLNHPASFVVLSVMSVLNTKRLRLLIVVSQSLKVLSPSSRAN